jgi:hypothetical protein
MAVFWAGSQEQEPEAELPAGLHGQPDAKDQSVAVAADHREAEQMAAVAEPQAVVAEASDIDQVAAVAEADPVEAGTESGCRDERSPRASHHSTALPHRRSYPAVLVECRHQKASRSCRAAVAVVGRTEADPVAADKPEAEPTQAVVLAPQDRRILEELAVVEADTAVDTLAECRELSYLTLVKR